MFYDGAIFTCNCKRKVMIVTIDPHSGFCYGVIRAIRMTEEALQNHEPLYSLGHIVHNELEVERLSKKGLRLASHDILNEEQPFRVLIRAHGEPPETYRKAEASRTRLIDATCPVVLKLQQKVRKAYEKSLLDGGTVVIYGKKGHAEVAGLMGQTRDQAWVVSSPEDLATLDVSKPIYLFSQTTMHPAGFKALSERLSEMRTEQGVSDTVPTEVNDTICRHVSSREQHLKRFSKEHDVILFIAGTQSSNGKILYNVCKRYNNCSYAVTSPDDIRKEWLESAGSVGICGATSTPKWLMEACKERVHMLAEQRNF